MGADAKREKVHFLSGKERCAAWHYPGTNRCCVIMTGGFAVNKEPATDLFAKRFNDAGFSVLAFEYRRIGESDGQPRLTPHIRDEQSDWHAAIDYARALPEVDPAKVALWAFSASAGHVLPVAARNPDLAAVIAQTPLVDAPRALPGAMRYSTPRAQLRLMGRGIRDTLGGLVGRKPILVPLAGARGTVAMISTPDGLEGNRALNGSRYPEWAQQVAARSVLRLGNYRPGRYARRVRCPLLVLVTDDDRTAPAGPAIRAAKRAPNGELVRVPGGHYAPFLEAHEQAFAVELSFVERHLLGRSRAQRSEHVNGSPRGGYGHRSVISA